MDIPASILVPVIVLAGCAFLAGWFLARLTGRSRHIAGDPARCPACRATIADPWWKPSDDLIVRRRLAEYVATVGGR